MHPPKPFIKWLGGKRQFLPFIKQIIPKKENYSRFIEPFVGGGSVFFVIQPYKVIINDINHELITAYLIIKNNPHKLIALLKEYQQKHSKEFHTYMKAYRPQNDLEVAGRFIYLNRASFNGLYRLNKKGEFNSSFNKEKTVKFNWDNILVISKYLNNNQIQILNQDYRKLANEIKQGDFLFVDPPYDKAENTKKNSRYFTYGWTRQNQKELFKFLKKMDNKRVKWLLTNHATDFIKELYSNYHQIVKPANRMINCIGGKRKNGSLEIFISNYTTHNELLTQEAILNNTEFPTIKHCP